MPLKSEEILPVDIRVFISATVETTLLETSNLKQAKKNFEIRFNNLLFEKLKDKNKLPELFVTD